MNWLRMTALAGALFVGAESATAVAAPDATKPADWLDVEVGRSLIFNQDRPIERVLVSDDTIVDIKLLQEGQLQLRGIEVGSTDLWVWYRDNPRPVGFELTVHQDLSDLIRKIDVLVDAEPPKVYPMLDRLVVEGKVADVQTLERVAQVAAVFDKEFINLMAVTGDHQIQLEVVFAEIDRTALREMGINAMWGSDAIGVNSVGPASVFSQGAVHPSVTSLNGGAVAQPVLGAFNLMGTLQAPVNLAAVLSVMEQNNISKVLAQPTLVALSGQQAEFLAGGEIPIPVAQTNDRITLEFKEYGVKLVFVPTVLANNVVDVRVAVEVSEIDSASGIRFTGVEIPGFLSRKSQSHVRLESGMTFAMAGMLHEQIRATYAKVPILGDIPVVGSLFRYVQHRRTESEIMIFVTPRLVRPLAEGEVPAPPGTTENMAPNDFELFMLGLDHRSDTRTAKPTGPAGMDR